MSNCLNILIKALHPKDEDRNYFSATFHMIVIALISMSMVDLTWFVVSGNMSISFLTLGQFFWFGYTSDDSDYSEYDYINSSIVNMMRTTILLCFMAIIFSLIGFFLDIIGPKSVLYKMIRRYAVPGTCTLLWIMAIVSVTYYVILLIEDSLAKIYPKVDQTVSYGLGFYMFTAAGGFCLVGIFYNLIFANHPSGYFRDDDRCLIDGFEDGLDTFNSPTPPPPYNVPPPPYTP